MKTKSLYKIVYNEMHTRAHGGKCVPSNGNIIFVVAPCAETAISKTRNSFTDNLSGQTKSERLIDREIRSVEIIGRIDLE